MAENEQPPTPEKQLLKLIENPKQDALRQESKRREGLKWFSFSALKGKFSFWQSLSSTKWFSLRRFTHSPVGLRQVNTILKVLIVIGSIYFIYAVSEMGIELNRASNLIFEPDKGVRPEQEETGQLKSLAYYLEKVSVRNIFSIPEFKAKPVKEKPAEAPAKKTKEDLSKTYSLVGIAWSANPEVMIEDVQKKRTHFVHRGQIIDEKVKVVSIFKDKVILSRDGKEFELR